MKSLFFLIIMTQGCVYQFSNLTDTTHQASPKKIFVENIHNNSKTNLPYDILWEEIQRHFISSNKLSPSSINSADFFLRTVAVTVQKKQYNSNNAIDPQYSTKLINPATNEPYKLSDYSSSKKGTIYSTKNKINLHITIELWDLIQQKKILTKSYKQEIHWDLINTDTSPSNLFIRSTENQDYFFKNLAASLSQNITTDCLNVLNRINAF